jgi:hypothetical protein
MNNEMTWDTLNNDLVTYMLRTDETFVVKLPYIIQQGIIRIYNNAKDIGFETVGEFNLANNNYIIQKPGNWRETISFSIIDNQSITYLLPRTYEYCSTYWPNLLLTEKPKFYYDFANNENLGTYGSWNVSPAPDKDYQVKIVYLSIPLFDAKHSKNFLTLRYPNLLLYSCLIEASLFLDNEEKRNKYEMMFSKELETINRMNFDRTTDRTIVRDKS